jgi:hypothetical protein
VWLDLHVYVLSIFFDCEHMQHPSVLSFTKPNNVTHMHMSSMKCIYDWQENCGGKFVWEMGGHF